MAKKTADPPIVVEALGKRLGFDDLTDLAGHVEEILANRGGVFDSLELACISELARRGNGQASADVQRIARQTAFHSPADNSPPKPRTPLDDEITEAAEAVESAEVGWIEARRTRDQVERELHERHARAAAKAKSAGDLQNRIGQINERHFPRLREAEEDVRVAREALTRKRARLNALRLASDRWRYDREARFHNPADPTRPLTLAELGKGE